MPCPALGVLEAPPVSQRDQILKAAGFSLLSLLSAPELLLADLSQLTLHRDL
jgi:hypothetical protein